MRIEWSKKALKNLQKIPSDQANRIIDKMDWFVEQDDPLSFADVLQNSSLGTHRFRIGDYRTICIVHKNQLIITVVRVGHRQNVYK